MDEFLAVAKSLEIKELCNASPEPNGEPDDEPSPCEPVTSSENLEDETVKSDQINVQAPQESQRRVVSVNGKYECDQCHKTYSSRQGLYLHKQTVHQGFKYACNQCDYQATQQGNLKIHIQSL